MNLGCPQLLVGVHVVAAFRILPSVCGGQVRDVMRVGVEQCALQSGVSGCFW